MKIEGVTHWSIPVNDLAESEHFYADILGLEHRGRLGDSGMACVRAGDHNILLCQRSKAAAIPDKPDSPAHHSFHMSSVEWEKGVRTLADNKVPIKELVYREQGFFLGRELYFQDPSGNQLELRDPNWEPGMPKPSVEEILAGVTAA